MSAPRTRRTKAELAALHEAILTACERDHPLSVRGVFYRVMSMGAIPKTEAAYNTIQREVLKLRRAGDLPYGWIADGTRWAIRARVFDDVAEMLEDAAASYRRALWHDQDVYVEVWAEKDAITSIIADTVTEWAVPLMVARGFASETFLWATAQELRRIEKPAIIYNLGDHDPSGLAAWDDIQHKLPGFAPEADLTFERIAVTPEQIVQLDLPTRPTKTTDSRARKFRGESVEVDAIPTSTLLDLVTTAITRHIDQDRLDALRAQEQRERDSLYEWADQARWEATS